MPVCLFFLSVLAAALVVPARAADLPVIGDERAVRSHLDLAAAADMNTADLVAIGRNLFEAKFTILDGAGRPLATQAEVPTKREAGGTPPMFRTSGPDSNACNGCHNQPESGGAGEFVTNVFVSEGIRDAEFDTLDPQFSNERGTPPVHGSGFVELLAREMTAELQGQRDSGLKAARASGQIQQVDLSSKGVGFGRLMIRPDGFMDVGEIEGIDFDLVVRPFGQKGVFSSLRQFTINAMNAHHGIQAPERYGRQWTDTADFDGDGVENELSRGDVTALVAYQATLPMPRHSLPGHPHLDAAVVRGEKSFSDIGCGRCHRPYLPLRSLVFEEPGPYNYAGNLRPTDAAPVVRFEMSSFGLSQNENGDWMIPVYSDLKRHVIADDAHPYFANELLSQRYVPRDVFLSAKLWAVGNTAPYGHRGDISTLRETILYHGGAAGDARDAFEAAAPETQADIIEFLKSLRIAKGGAS